MKKLVIILVFSLYAVFYLLPTAFSYYGQFYDGTSSRDSVWMNVATFDTLGQLSNADTVIFFRFYGTTLIDSTILTGAGNLRTGHYVTGKRAFNGTNYGEYTVGIRWRVQGKLFQKNESYTVFPDSISAVGRLSTNIDKTNYQLASGQVIARADSVTGVGRLSTNLDKTGYEINLSYPDSVLKLRGLHIRGTAGSDTALIAQGYGGGMGIFAYGGANSGDGAYIRGRGTGAGIVFFGGQTNGEGILAQGMGTGPGALFDGGGSGRGFHIRGHGTAHALYLEGGGTSGYGLYATGAGGDIDANIAGNLSGSVGSVTGSVGSVINDVGITQAGADKVWLTTTRALTDKVNFGLTTSYWTKADSSANAKIFWNNQNIPQANRRIQYVDSLGEELSAVGDWTTAEKNQLRFAMGINGVRTRPTTTGWNQDSTWLFYNYTALKDSVFKASVDTLPYVRKVISTDTAKYVADIRNNDTTYSSNAGTGLDSATTSRIIGRKVWGIISNGSDSSTSDQRKIGINYDKTNYQLASGQVVARADSVTGVGRISTNRDKTNYQLASGQVVARADSVTGVGRISTNLDKTGYRLSSQGQADIWTHDTTGENSGWAQFFKGRLDVNVSSRLSPGDSGIIARAPWDNDLIAQASRRIRYVDSLGEDVTGSGATNPDTIANHVWIWNTRTLTSGAGTGSNQVTIYTLQSSDSIPISAVQVQVLNQNQTATEGLLTSNALGQSVFALNDGIYKIRMFKPGWQFTVPESITVSGNSMDTFYADIFDPGTPPSAELCRVYGWVQDLKGEPVVGATIEAKISNAPLRYQTVLISPYYKTTTTDSDGYWHLDLYPNSKLTPSDTKYDFTIYIPYGTILKLKATVPEESSWELVW